MSKIRVGDIITLHEDSFWYKKGYRLTGRVISVYEGTDNENHGSVNVILTDCPKYYLKVGDEENFVHFGWEKHLKIIESKYSLED